MVTARQSRLQDTLSHSLAADESLNTWNMARWAGSSLKTFAQIYVWQGFEGIKPYGRTREPEGMSARVGGGQLQGVFVHLKVVGRRSNTLLGG